jgi:hypothetical protein
VTSRQLGISSVSSSFVSTIDYASLSHISRPISILVNGPFLFLGVLYACENIVNKRTQRLKPCRRHSEIQGAQLTSETGGCTKLHKHLPCRGTAPALARIVVECELSSINAVRRTCALGREYEVVENMALQTFSSRSFSHGRFLVSQVTSV